MKNRGSLELTWINKDMSLYFEFNEEQSIGDRPKWVERSDIRVSEPRILRLKEKYGDQINSNFLIKGDNLLALRTLVEHFKGRQEYDKVKFIYIDPPYNTGSAFDYYEDNLELSQWLTMMRDRLQLLKLLMRDSGIIAVQINHLNVGLLRNIMDEIFGRRNFVQIITVETSDPSGHATVNPGVYNAAEFILIYAKEKSLMEYNKNMRVPTAHDFGYNKVVINKYSPVEQWEIENISETVSKQAGYKNSREMRAKVGESYLQSEIEKFALKNPTIVFQSTAISDKAGKTIVELREKSKKEKNRVFVLRRENHYDIHVYNGRDMYFYSNKVKNIGGVITNTKPLTNIWTDISWNGISREGGVDFPRSKKPERLIKRMLEIFTVENEIVLDSFLGSGTTAAVAHKMGRRWIGIEIGKHAETKCLKRLASVVLGNDQSGVSKECKWKGGGGFNYYEIGPSVLQKEEIEWDMVYNEIAEAVFLNFGYSGTKKELQLNPFVSLCIDKGKIAACIINRDPVVISQEDFEGLLYIIGSDYSDYSLMEIYTNLGMAILEEDLPENCFIRKIPEHILMKYGL